MTCFKGMTATRLELHELFSHEYFPQGQPCLLVRCGPFKLNLEAGTSYYEIQHFSTTAVQVSCLPDGHIGFSTTVQTPLTTVPLFLRRDSHFLIGFGFVENGKKAESRAQQHLHCLSEGPTAVSHCPNTTIWSLRYPQNRASTPWWFTHTTYHLRVCYVHKNHTMTQ